jgi:TonB-linked SusC/RagA family outer membrane protein
MRTHLPYQFSSNKVHNLNHFKIMKKKFKSNGGGLYASVRRLLVIMKIVTALMFAGLIQVSAASFAQQKKLDLSFKNQQLHEVFQQIEQNSEFSIFYSEELIGHVKLKSGKFVQEDVVTILDELLQGEDLTYRIVDQLIVILPVQKEVNNETAAQQKHVVSGKVIDAQGEPIPGVNVYEKENQTNGVITGVDGSYSITVDSPEDILVFSFIGFDDQEIHISARNQIDITLVEEATGLNEVVVVGYGTQKKATMTGAVTNLKMDDLSEVSTSNMSSLLAGRLSGVYVSNNMGTPGVASSIKIRENASWNSNPPVYVIDGIVRDKSDFDKLDVSEIAEVSILKDGASAAVYGSRAAGGVILVETKKGEIGKPTIEYNMSHSFEEPTKLPEMMSGVDIARMGNSYLDPGNWAYWQDDELAWLSTINNGYGFDYLDEVYKNPTSTRHALNVNGGNEKIKYFIGGSLFDQTGFLDNLGYKKYNIRSNLTAQITDDLKASLQLSNVNSKRNKFYWPYDWGSDELGDLWKKLQTWQYYEPIYINGYPPNTGWLGNIGELISGRSGYWEMREQTQNAVASLEYSIPFIEGLSAKGTFSYSTFNFQEKTFSKKHKLYNVNRESTHSFPDEINGEDDYVWSNGPGREFIYREDHTNRSYQFNAQLNYARSFGSHNIDALFVYEQSEGENSNIYGQRYDFPIIVKDQLFATSDNAEDSSFGGGESESGRTSYIGRLNYDYASKYLLSASFRYDGSMIFGPGQRWGFFPAVSAGWRLSEEAFFDVAWIDNLKLRGSVGLLGNDAISPWYWQERYVPSSGFYFGEKPSSVKGITYGGIVNPYVTWEKSLNYNVGVDVLFAKRLNLSAEYWMKKQTDILGPRNATVPTTFGGSLPYENYGEVHARGFELELTYNNTIAGQVNYFVKGIFGYATNKVIKRDYAENARDIDIPIGRPIGYITGVEADDILRTQADLDALPEGWTVWGRAPQLGDMNYKDLSGPDGTPDGKIDDYDKAILHKHGSAPYSFGLNLGLDWKGFSMDALFQGLAGGKKFYSFQPPYPWTRVYKYWDDYWSPDNVDASMPHPDYNIWQNRAGSTFNLQSTTFVRLKYLNVGYNLPERLISRIGVQGLKVFFSGNNLFYISKFKHYDPEVGHSGVYPNMKTFTFGLNLKI